MSDKLSYVLSPRAEGKRVEWKSVDGDVKVLFHKDREGNLKASVVTFNATSFTPELAERWLANRVAQYCLNSQIDSLNRYESTLLAALIDYSPKFKAIAEKWYATPAGWELDMAQRTNNLFNKGVIPQDVKPQDRPNPLMHRDNPTWLLSREIRKRLRK